MAKIVSFRKAVKLAEELRKQGKKIVYTSGCFDILHIGHIRFLKLLRKWAGTKATIFVGIETDEYLRNRKGKDRPLFIQSVRSEMLSIVEGIDYVINLKDQDFIKRYKEIHPDWVVFGNTEQYIVKLIKIQTVEAGCKFKVIARRNRPSSTSYLLTKLLQI